MKIGVVTNDGRTVSPPHFAMAKSYLVFEIEKV
jgi:hypothetical protein